MLNQHDKVYHQYLEEVLQRGIWQRNDRTGKHCLSMSGALLRFDVSHSFPILTTKKTAYSAAFAELVGFMRSVQSAADFRALGTKIWDQNANETPAWLANPFRKGEDDLGPIYGVQWRKWRAYKFLQGLPSDKIREHLAKSGWESLLDNGDRNTNDSDWQEVFHKEIDQVADCIRKLILNPSDRRILFTGWNPAVFDEVALPPCHMTYQFLPSIATKELSIKMDARSIDSFLGLPFNIISTTAVLYLIAHLTGYRPKDVIITIGDAHIYEDHEKQVQEQLNRKESFEPPQLYISDRVPAFQELLRNCNQDYEAAAALAIKWLDEVQPSDFTVQGYQSHPAIKAPMAA